MVFSLAVHALRSRPAAEDLAQEVFVELYRNLARLESAAHVAAWLRRVTSHRCIDELRRPRRRLEVFTDALPDRGRAASLARSIGPTMGQFGIPPLLSAPGASAPSAPPSPPPPPQPPPVPGRR